MSDGNDGPGLYLVTPPLASADGAADRLAAALDAAPAAALRLRFATEDEDAIRRIADAAREVAHARDVAVAITDHFRLAQQLGLDGVHLADPRLRVTAARKALGPDMIVGAYAGASRHDGMNAAEAGADYVAFGPVTANGLGGGEAAGDDLFAWWAEMIETPAVAEGGLTLDDVRRLAEWVDFVAVDAVVWDHPGGPAAGARAVAKALTGA